MTFGPHSKPNSNFHLGPWNWTLLYTSDGSSPSRMFFDVTPYGIHKLAFESPEPQCHQIPAIPRPVSAYPESASLDDYFYTSAALENVVEITPCEGKAAGSKQSIIGLLFRYADGHQACVGQFRLDCAGTTLVVVGAASPRLWLSFDKDDDGRPFVSGVGVGVCRAPERESHDCLYVSWDGNLEWWFTYNQCKVYYKSQSSILTRM